MRKRDPKGAIVAAALLLMHGQAGAHGGAGPAPTLAWELEPLMVLSLVIPLLLYAWGSVRLWRRMRATHGLSLTRTPCFLSGWLVLVLALLSPLHPLGNELFYAHMIQHELLMIVAAPLLVLGRPLVPMLWGLPQSWRRGAAGVLRSRPWEAASGFLMQPLTAWLFHAVVLWLWHLPSWFEAALHDDAVHALQHAGFLGSALIFWQSMVHGRQGALTYGAAVLFLFTTALHSGLLGALLTLAGSPWYPSYLATTPAWGLSALEDQQLGGLIMWIPAGVVYLVAGLAFFAAWLQASERQVRAGEPPRSPTGRCQS